MPDDAPQPVPAEEAEAERLDRLAARATAGDRMAFTELLELTAHGLRLFVTARLRSRALIDEVVQDTYVIAWERLGTYQGPRRLGAWLRGIAYNRVRVELRELHRHRPVDQDELDVLLTAPETADEEADPDTDLAPHLATCLEQLDARARLLLQRRYGDDLPLPQLAQQFKRNVHNLTMMLHRLRLALRACVQARSRT
jgi:RNA polymerase sigma-70 factor, ECF subfamily